jgi:hypothetical protein
MRDLQDRALDYYPHYPPGFRPCHLEPRSSGEEKNWNLDYPPMQLGHAQWHWLHLVDLHYCFICMEMI